MGTKITGNLYKEKRCQKRGDEDRAGEKRVDSF